jgi:hypothetical protein
VSRHSLWCIDVSPATVATALAVDVSTILSYTAVIVDITGPGQYYSEFYPVTLDHTTPKDRMDVLFQNSFGVYEVMEFKGLISKKAQSEKQEVSLMLNDPARDQSVNHVLSAKTLNSYSLSTGYISKAKANTLQELFNSRDVYLVQSDHYQPVSITAAAHALHDTDSGSLNGFDITFTEEIQEQYL